MAVAEISLRISLRVRPDQKNRSYCWSISLLYHWSYVLITDSLSLVNTLSWKYNYFLTYRGLSYYYYYLCSLTRIQQLPIAKIVLLDEQQLHYLAHNREIRGSKKERKRKQKRKKMEAKKKERGRKKKERGSKKERKRKKKERKRKKKERKRKWKRIANINKKEKKNRMMQTKKECWSTQKCD